LSILEYDQLLKFPPKSSHSFTGLFFLTDILETNVCYLW